MKFTENNPSGHRPTTGDKVIQAGIHLAKAVPEITQTSGGNPPQSSSPPVILALMTIYIQPSIT